MCQSTPYFIIYDDYFVFMLVLFLLLLTCFLHSNRLKLYTRTCFPLVLIAFSLFIYSLIRCQHRFLTAFDAIQWNETFLLHSLTLWLYYSCFAWITIHNNPYPSILSLHASPHFFLCLKQADLASLPFSHLSFDWLLLHRWVGTVRSQPELGQRMSPSFHSSSFQNGRPKYLFCGFGFSLVFVSTLVLVSVTVEIRTMIKSFFYGFWLQ